MPSLLHVWPIHQKIAKRIGCTATEYIRHRESNEGWCMVCKDWFKMPIETSSRGMFCPTHYKERWQRIRDARKERRMNATKKSQTAR